LVIDEEMIENVIQVMFRRSEAAKAAGGISEYDRMNGVSVPEGWKLDYELDYWLPPNVILMCGGY